jgi:hypothetical protein
MTIPMFTLMARCVGGFGGGDFSRSPAIAWPES